MRRRLTGLFSIILAFVLQLSGQINAYYSSCLFFAPEAGPYLETSLTLAGKSLSAKRQTGGFQNSVNINFTILRDSQIVKANRYNLLGPVFTSSASAPSFIDQQRYTLPNGKYILSFTLTDNYAWSQKPLVIREELTVDFNQELQFSTIQAIETYRKANEKGRLTKSGLDLVPYNANYYPETMKQLAVYLEGYNAASVLGESEPLLFTWHLEDERDGSTLNEYGSFKKMSAAAVNPLLAAMDISRLPSGNYRLVVELKDKENKTRLSDRYYFRRVNRRADLVKTGELRDKRTVAEFFGNCNNADTLQMFVECLWPIAGDLDKERIINQAVKKEPEMMKRFVVDFWERRAADTANPLQMWASYYQQVQQVVKLFKCGKQKGYYTERGRVYLQYGAPNQRSVQANEPNTFPYEIWQYYRITDGVNGQFYSNRKFVFVNKNLGDDCHQLVHSDMRGEINNPRWAFEVSRRNTMGISNPDQNTPAGTGFNQFGEIYSNPR
jgi:GWxTD domain-containing protein